MDGYSSSIQRPQWGKFRIDQMSRWQIGKLMQHRARQRVQTQVGKCGNVQAERDCLSTQTQVKSLALPAEQVDKLALDETHCRVDAASMRGSEAKGRVLVWRPAKYQRKATQTEHATSLDSSSEDERGSGSMPAAGILSQHGWVDELDLLDSGNHTVCLDSPFAERQEAP